MLQRPQTLYFLGSLILSFLLFTGPLAVLTAPEGEYLLTFSGLKGPSGDPAPLATWPMTALLVALASLSFLVIFLYRNRARQMRFTVFLILLFAGGVVMILFYTIVARKQVDALGTVLLWRIVIPLINPILNYLAFRRIRRDELLVKAYDRIR